MSEGVSDYTSEPVSGTRMRMAAVGLNHQTAPIALREQLAFRTEALVEVSRALKRELGLAECVVLSTCNRAEFYGTGENCSPDAILEFLSRFRNADLSELESHSYRLTGLEVVEHLARVASGLDSMVLGESQVLAQVKSALEGAAEAGTTGPILNAAVRQAVTAGKRARTETTIARGAVSISHAAVELARQIFGELSGCRALVLGAGEMGEITLKLLRSAGMKSTIMISSRTRERAEEVAQRCQGIGIEWERFPDALAQADIVIVSTSAPHYIVRCDAVRQVMRARRGRSMFLIDISVPRNVEPSTGDLPDVFLYNVDDLQGVVQKNLGDRSREVEKVEQIIAEEIERFTNWLNGHGVAPAIVGLRARGEVVRQQEWDRFSGRLAHLPERDRQTVETLTRQIVQRLLEEPVTQLKKLGVNGKGYDRVEVVRELFALEHKEEGAHHLEMAAAGESMRSEDSP